MKETRMPPAYSANLVANSGNTIYGVSVIWWIVVQSVWTLIYNSTQLSQSIHLISVWNSVKKVVGPHALNLKSSTQNWRKINKKFLVLLQSCWPRTGGPVAISNTAPDDPWFVSLSWMFQNSKYIVALRFRQVGLRSSFLICYFYQRLNSNSLSYV